MAARIADRGRMTKEQAVLFGLLQAGLWEKDVDELSYFPLSAESSLSVGPDLPGRSFVPKRRFRAGSGRRKMHRVRKMFVFLSPAGAGAGINGSPVSSPAPHFMVCWTHERIPGFMYPAGGRAGYAGTGAASSAGLPNPP